MRNKTVKSKKSGKLYNFIIIILSVFLVVSVLTLALNIRDDMQWRANTAKDMSYNYEGNNYYYLVRKMYENESNHVKTDAWMEEYYAVARYYEAALRQKAYAEAGQSERAEAFQAVMEEQIPLMGPYTDCISKIEEMLQSNF